MVNNLRGRLGKRPCVYYLLSDHLLHRLDGVHDGLFLDRLLDATRCGGGRRSRGRLRRGLRRIVARLRRRFDHGDVPLEEIRLRDEL